MRSRLLSFGMVLGIGFLLIVSLVASAAVAALGKFSAPLFGAWVVVAELLNLVVSFALVTVTFAMIYKIMPRVRIGWRDVWIGAAVTALLFAIGKSLIGLYLGRSSFASGFGAAGSLVVLLALDVLLGADLPARRRVHAGLRADLTAPAATRRRRRRSLAPGARCARRAPGTRVLGLCWGPSRPGVDR